MTCQATLAGGPVRQPFAEVSYIPQSGAMNLATDSQGLRSIFISRSASGNYPAFLFDPFVIVSIANNVPSKLLPLKKHN